ncbi:MAG: hypothetical protein A2516_03160 [Alphaproteobacteria bacterium RIFOXYD12_FULL_60_8]|nr:MAG: hypothetical protein A2516_03160 [Alphaproteobacteria bacterium RIFOXYD12_FULL_60_8]
MAAKPLFIILCSGEREKLQMAAMIGSVAAVSDRPVELFVSMNAILAFEKDKSAEQRYHGGHFAKAFAAKGAPDPVDLLGQGKMLGEMKIWACTMVLDVQGWSMANLVDDVFDGEMGLTKFLSDAEDGELITL